MTHDVEAATRIIGRAARELDIKILTDYCGRGMFGATCLAVIEDPDNWHDLDDLFKTIGDESIEKFRLDSHYTDSMGRGMVMYWRHLRTNNSESGMYSLPSKEPMNSGQPETASTPPSSGGDRGRSL
jgi:hypothetical protein